MELVTIPLSQRTRSEPVTRIQAEVSGATAAECRRASNSRLAEVGGAMKSAGWRVVGIVKAAKNCVHC